MRPRAFALFRRPCRAAVASMPQGGHGRGLVARFFRARSGATLFEFALVSPIFLLLTFAIMETGIILMTQAMLDNATRDAARQIRIGQDQNVGDTDGTGLFKQTMCNDLGNFIPCNNLTWHVQSVANGGSFSTMSGAVTTDASGNMTSTGFTPGTQRSLVLVQVAYNRTYLIPFLARVGGGANGSLLLVSSLAFQNENYQ
jgi:Flp pilus assembly protein TadG